ncbi:MAG: hypothetical protein ACE5IM_03820 [Nitrospinota bacterium]
MAFPRRRPALRLTAALLVTLLAACGRSVPESEEAARAFVEAYYVRADLTAAARWAEGLAREKIDRQAKLRKEAETGGSGPASPGLSGRRSVEYKILETRERADGRKVYRIALTIVSSPVTLDVQTIVTVGRSRKGDRRRWVVVNFMDVGPSRRPSGK